MEKKLEFSMQTFKICSPDLKLLDDKKNVEKIIFQSLLNP